MEFRELGYFITAYEHNSFTKAAEQLHLTQQAISKAVAKLENEFGTALFIRKKTTLQPTEFGNVFYEKTKHLFTEYQKTMDSLKSLAKETSKLRIGFAANVIPALNAETLIMDFRKKYPAVELIISNFTDYECEEALLNRKIDFAFSMGPFLSSRIQSTLLVNEPIHALLSVKHPLSDREALTMEDLADKPLILADSRNKGHAQTRSFIQKKWGHINIIFQTNDPVTHLHMVSKQMGISLFPDHLKPIFEKAEGVRILPITDHPQRSIYLIFEPQTMPPRCMQQFMKFTIAFYKDT